MTRYSGGGNDPRLEKAKEIFSRKTFPPGAVIFRQGDPGTHAYMIMRGEVSILAVNDRGKTVDLGILSNGQVVGEMALMIKGPRTASAVAKTSCELMIVKPAQFEKKLKDIDPLMRLWVETLAERIVATMRKAD
jgi:CRP-like cAMP-binding protein